MTNPVMVSGPVTDASEKRRSLAHRLWCPGCNELHMPYSLLEGCEPMLGPHWDWDGNTVRPTFSPSLLVQSDGHVCHSYIREGRWQFLGDCTHALANQTVDMVPLPDWLVR